MKKLILSKRKLFSSLVAGFLVFSFMLAPVSQTLQLRVASAQGGPSFETNPAVVTPQWIQAIEGKVSAVANSVSAKGLTSLGLKEWAFDGVAFALINIVLKEMIRSTTMWVKSGFKGSPAFVTDMEGFLTDIADKVAGNFIYGTTLDFVCSPFKLNIQLALDIQYKATRGYQAQCRLSTAIKNIDRFLDGDFFSGGWNGWYSVTLTPSNNPYGAMLEAESALYASIGNSQKAKLDILSYGSGFLSTEYCRSEGDDQRCAIETPGVIVQDQLNRALGFGGDRLVVADEVNELVGALFSQLAKEALSGVGGLLGLGEARSGQRSYFDRMSAERTLQTYVDGAVTPGTADVDSETKYRDLQRTIFDLITDASTYKVRTYGREEAFIDDEGNAQTRGCPATGELTTSLRNQLTRAEKEIASSTALIAILNVFATDYNLLSSPTTSQSRMANLLTKYGATSVPDAQSRLMNQYMGYQTSGALHATDVIVRLELQGIPDLRTEIQTFTATLDNVCSRNQDGGE